MIVQVSTHLAARPSEVWEHVQTPALLRHVAAPLVTFTSRSGPHCACRDAMRALPKTLGAELRDRKVDLISWIDGSPTVALGHFFCGTHLRENYFAAHCPMISEGQGS